MKLKKNINLIDFFNATQKCKFDVYMETEEEDRLNLKSMLTQYLLAALAQQKDIWQHAEITCNREDIGILRAYLEE